MTSSWATTFARRSCGHHVDLFGLASRPKGPVFFSHGPMLSRSRDRQLQLISVKQFHHKVPSTSPHGFNRLFIEPYAVIMMTGMCSSRSRMAQQPKPSIPGIDKSVITKSIFRLSSCSSRRTIRGRHTPCPDRAGGPTPSRTTSCHPPQESEPSIPLRRNRQSNFKNCLGSASSPADSKRTSPW